MHALPLSAPSSRAGGLHWIVAGWLHTIRKGGPERGAASLDEMWREHVVPRMADVSLRGHEVGELRDLALGGLRGRVLEIGFGSGLNVRWYPPEVTSVGAVEPSDVGWRLSERRRARVDVPIERTGLDGERIDEPDASYDGAVSTFTLCTIPDAAAALREVRRVLRPGATFHVLEHGLAPDADVVTTPAPVGAGAEAARRRLPPHPRPRRAPRRRPASRSPQREAAYLPGPRFQRPWTYVSPAGLGLSRA